jgi:hypothetical protein
MREDRWLSPKQADERLGVTVQALAAMRGQGRGPQWHKARDSSFVRYRESDLDAYLEPRSSTADGRVPIIGPGLAARR